MEGNNLYALICIHHLQMKRQKVYTGQKIKFSIKDFFSEYDQVRRKLRIWSHLLKESFMEIFFFVQCNLFPEDLDQPNDSSVGSVLYCLLFNSIYSR